jgi:lysophospholipase L1-like esterase
VLTASRSLRSARASIVVALLVTLGACSSSRATSAPPPSTAPPPTLAPALVANLEEVTTMTALGDSVPSGTACNCTPYPQLTAADIARVVGHPVDTANDATAGYLSSDVVDQLEHDSTVMGHVARSQAVTVQIGANDVAYSSQCGNDVACYEQRIPPLRTNLETIIGRIRTLTAGHAVTIVLLDYWSVWLGGQYAEAQGPDYVDAAKAVTDSVSDTISALAQSSHCYYVDLRGAFRGPSYSWDETHLLASDGDHPNAAGHVRITRAIEATIALHA